MPTLGPRLVVAGTHSGVGKTTVATGLMAALAGRGQRVAAAKIGPDFIDPGYHAVATGRPAHTLDAWLSGEALLGPLAAQAAAGSDVLVIEGVMGLFDGSAQPGTDGSTAAVARSLSAPVVLVVDASAMSGSVAAVVHGFATFDAGVRLAGVVLNRVGGPGHAELLRQALGALGLPVLEVILEDAELSWRERHLGLVPVAEDPDTVRRSLSRLARVMVDSCDLDALVSLARSAPALAVAHPPAAERRGGVRIALAGGPAFSFVYPENLQLLEQAGAELVPFDPCSDSRLPDRVDALYAGGGFPESYAAALADNAGLLADVRLRVGAGLVVWAECGGLLWLSRSLDGAPMVGAVPADARMTERLTIGYRQAATRVASPLGPAGTALRGHEFHRTVTEPDGDALDLSSGGRTARSGFAGPTLFAAYLHQHLSATPAVAESFVATAAAASATGSAAPTGSAAGRVRE